MMDTPQWHPKKLEAHYDKRVHKDDDCWRELLSINRSMTSDEYGQETYKAYRTGSLEYEAEYSLHSPALYRVDKRAVLTVADRKRERMITCYHKHYSGRHEAGSSGAKFENLLVYIDDLEASLDGDLEKIFRIDPVPANLSGNQLRKYIGPKLKSLRGKCTKDG